MCSSKDVESVAVHKSKSNVEKSLEETPRKPLRKGCENVRAVQKCADLFFFFL